MPEEDRPAGSPLRRRAMPALVIVAALGLASAWLVWSAARRRQEPGAKSLTELIADIESGEPDALARARQAAARDWAAARPAVRAMLGHETWAVRVAACEILADRAEEKWAAVLLPRCSDSDWRVRAAAFAALGRLHPMPASAAFRDLPLDRRETLLLDWLARRDAKAEQPLGTELCELYAGVRSVEFGRPMAARCLNCHAGATPAPAADSATCAACHGEVHRDWQGSAHAQSLSHLRLRTINPVTRQGEWMGFGDLRGISCVECHRLAPTQPPPTTTPAARGATCPFSFDPAQPAADACARCHAPTHRQWLAWRRGRQPRRATWPPGQVDLEFRDDKRTCADCHMPVLPVSGRRPPRDHRWAARRDLQLLQAGVDLRAVRVGGAADGQRARLMLTNLAGHAYPTGSRRRALRLYVGHAAAAGIPLIATLSPVRPGLLWADCLPALAPGEQRSFDVSLPADASGLAYRLVYHRNHYDPAAYTAEILSAATPLGE